MAGQKAEYKAVFHIDRDEISTFELMIANIKNFLADVNDADIAVVANGPAVRIFTKLDEKSEEELNLLHKRGVRFFLCRNALRVHKIDEQDVPKFCEIVPAGITKIVELQRDGYSYIKP
ncbi:MAG: DsrE family protein [Candidatus Methanodesulfokora sp.]|jgi:intracellular sulfur oxidation DsrE/DsrF family protein